MKNYCIDCRYFEEKTDLIVKTYICRKFSFKIKTESFITKKSTYTRSDVICDSVRRKQDSYELRTS